MTQLVEDVMATGMSGTLTVTRGDSNEFSWHWLERYRWWGPYNGTDIWGQLVLNALVIDANVTAVVTRLECDWGDCDGPLHGRYDLVFDGSRLVITRRDSVNYYWLFGSFVAWSRLTLWQQ